MNHSSIKSLRRQIRSAERDKVDSDAIRRLQKDLNELERQARLEDDHDEVEDKRYARKR